MRTRLVVAALLIAAVPSATAQMSGPIYLLDVTAVPEGSITPGGLGEYTFAAARVCSINADVLPATVAHVQYISEGNFSVAGPGQVEFPQQVCMQQSRVDVTITVTVAIPADAPDQVSKIHAHLSPGMDGAVPRYSQGASAETFITVKSTAASVEKSPLGEAKDAPGPTPLILPGLLGLAALAMRRRL